MQFHIVTGHLKLPDIQLLSCIVLVALYGTQVKDYY